MGVTNFLKLTDLGRFTVCVRPRAVETSSVCRFPSKKATLTAPSTTPKLEPMSVEEVQNWLRKHHRFGEIPEDQAVRDQFPPRDFKIHAGHFLIDQAGIVRWVQIETPIDDLSRWGMFPTDDQILAAVRTAGL